MDALRGGIWHAVGSLSHEGKQNALHKSRLIRLYDDIVQFAILLEIVVLNCLGTFFMAIADDLRRTAFYRLDKELNESELISQCHSYEYDPNVSGDKQRQKKKAKKKAIKKKEKRLRKGKEDCTWCDLLIYVFFGFILV